jgi:mono/diheme cytochrome c family protein
MKNHHLPIWTGVLTGLGVIVAAASLLADKQTPPTPAPAPPEQTRLIASLDGQALFHEYCAVCHGDNAKGNGPMARVLKVPPADLTHIAMRNGGKFPFQRVEKIISGESEVNSHGTREMPIWGPIFSQIAWDQDLGKVRIQSLAKYLERIQTN